MVRLVRDRWGRKGAFSAWLFAGVPLLLVVLGTAAAEDLAFDEYEIKAAYLYHFGQFITWPNEESDPDGAPLVLGILGADPFGEKIDARLEGRAIRGRKVEVRRFPTLEEMRPCHILFVSATAASYLTQVVSKFENVSTLLVGESPRFAEKGGMIGFLLEDEAVRFQINAKRAGSAGLQVSSRLLDLATIVADDPEETKGP